MLPQPPIRLLQHHASSVYKSPHLLLAATPSQPHLPTHCAERYCRSSISPCQPHAPHPTALSVQAAMTLSWISTKKVNPAAAPSPTLPSMATQKNQPIYQPNSQTSRLPCPDSACKPNNNSPSNPKAPNLPSAIEPATSSIHTQIMARKPVSRRPYKNTSPTTPTHQLSQSGLLKKQSLPPKPPTPASPPSAS